MKYVLAKTMVGAGLIFSLITPHIKANSKIEYYDKIPYEMNVDYRSKMYACALMGDEMAMCLGDIYEDMRNAKLIALGREDEITEYFVPGKTGNDILIEMRADKMRLEHEYAAEVYEFFAKRGYSNVAIAAILGNMMNECGGNTLDLKPLEFDNLGLHYGLCQWNIHYNSKVKHTGVSNQLLYLDSTIADHMKQFGGSFEEFNSLESAEYAGTYFCRYYERGANAKQRGLNAIVAYEWIGRFK